ncbi:MAG: hypothetical protein NVV63_12605 [Opitutus sp.]|nr:hypothetical protein [Opitutus sp.]
MPMPIAGAPCCNPQRSTHNHYVHRHRTQTEGIEQRAPVDLKLIEPILAAQVATAKADPKIAQRFSRSPSLLAANVADEAEKQGIVKNREEWRGVYYPLKEKIVPQIFPRAEKASKS